MGAVLVLLLIVVGVQRGAEHDVKLSGGLSASQVKIGKSIQFWVTLENQTEADLKDIKVRLNIDELAFSCDSPLKDGACSSAKDKLLRGETETLKGTLKCTDCGELANINADVYYEVTLADAVKHAHRVVPLGHVVGRSSFREWFSAYKELCLPIVIAVLGGIIAARQSRVENRRAQVSETWNSMLPISHNLAMRYYMPMVKPLLRVQIDVAQYKSLPASELDTSSIEDRSIFFHVMLFWWLFDRVQNRRGAIYFKNRIGEIIVLNAFSKFRDLYKGERPRSFDVARHVNLIHREFNLKLDFTKFEEIVASRSDKTIFCSDGPLRAACEKAWRDFHLWYANEKSRRDGLKLLVVIAKVVTFEANRPYEQWYNTQELLELDSDDRETIQSLARTSGDASDLADYIRCADDRRWT